MNNNIMPFVSKRAKKNKYRYYDPGRKTTIEVAGFDIDVFDSIRSVRIRKRIKADYKTVKRIVEDIKKAIHQGEPNKVDELTGVKAQTLSDLFLQFRKRKQKDSNRVGNGISEETLKRYDVALKSMLKPGMKDISQVGIKQLTTTWIEKRLKERINRGLSLRTLNTDLTHLKRLFKWGVDNLYIDSNPFDSVPKFKVQRKEPRILSTNEWDRLWAIVKYGRWQPLILTYLLTGARISEILKPKLRWDHIDFDKDTITLAHRKRGKFITLPMPKLLKDALIKLQDNPYEKETRYSDDDNLYPFPFHKDYVSHVIKRDVFTPAGIMDISAHDLRRTFGSYLIHLGWPVAIVSQMMSHSSTAVTEQVYLGQLDSLQRKALDQLAQFLVSDDDNDDHQEQSSVTQESQNVGIDKKD